jgi:putative phosphoribosyl transferase
MFRDREDAAFRLAERMRKRKLTRPVVLAIPRGGVATGAVLARELGAELDVVLSRKLRAPEQPELAIGSIAEDGSVYLNEYARVAEGVTEDYLVREREFQMAQIKKRRELVRSVKEPAKVAGRSVIVTDDGIATGSTMIAALETLKKEKPLETIVAVPVAPPDRLEEIQSRCDEVICLLTPSFFWAIGEFYEEFYQVGDETVLELLLASLPAKKAVGAS